MPQPKDTAPPTIAGLITRLRKTHTYALDLRRASTSRGLQTLFGVVIVALDSALVFANQAQHIHQTPPTPPNDEATP